MLAEEDISDTFEQLEKKKEKKTKKYNSKDGE